MNTRMLLVCVKYSMCDLICDVKLLFEAAIWVKSIYITKSRFKTRKKENMEIKDIFT